MELAAKSFDLTRALIDLIPASLSVIDLKKEMYDWLVRKNIEEKVFTCCRGLAKNLAFPNQYGLDLLKQVKQADDGILQNFRKAPLRLVVSGSLGRLIGRDDDICYMVTTVAALTAYHDTPQFAADVISSMIFDEQNHEHGLREPKYQVQRLPIMAVVSKIVQSIYINVVNAGHTLRPIPVELRHLHPHILSYQSLAAIIVGIEQAKPGANIMIRSERFLADLTAWIYAHFDGVIEVSVERSFLYKEKLGSGDKMISMMVHRPCLDDGRSCCESKVSRKVEACFQVGGGLRTFFAGMDDVTARPYPCTRFQDLLQNHPRLLNINTGISSLRHHTFRRPETSKATWDFKEDPASNDIQATQRVILECFPFATSVLEDIAHHCRCPTCTDRERLDRCKRGCLRYAAMSRIFVLLAHGVADGFGIEDVSGSSHSEDITTDITLALIELIKDSTVEWDSWFRVVATVASGLSWSSLSFDPASNAVIGWSVWAAVQYGSVVLAAPWLDLNAPISINGCFATKLYQANIKGVTEEFGIVQCETSDSELALEEDPLEADAPPQPKSQRSREIIDLSSAMQSEDIVPEVMTGVFTSSPRRYRLVTVVKSQHHIRIIDPANVLINLCRVVSSSCEHAGSEDDGK